MKFRGGLGGQNGKHSSNSSSLQSAVGGAGNSGKMSNVLGSHHNLLCSSSENARFWLSRSKWSLLGISLFTWGLWMIKLLGILQTNRYIAVGYVTKRRGIVTLVFFALSLMLHLRTMLTDPGSVPRNAIIDSSRGYRCRVCKIEVPRFTWHCNICNRCIRHLDHHCIFLNNCIGMRNLKFFVLYLLYTFVAFLLSTFNSASSMLRQMPFCRILLKRLPLDILKMPADAISVFIGSIGSLYVFIIIQDQARHIADYGLYSTMGSNWWTWPLPTKPNLNEKRLLGYHLPSSSLETSAT